MTGPGEKKKKPNPSTSQRQQWGQGIQTSVGSQGRFRDCLMAESHHHLPPWRLLPQPRPEFPTQFKLPRGVEGCKLKGTLDTHAHGHQGAVRLCRHHPSRGRQSWPCPVTLWLAVSSSSGWSCGGSGRRWRSCSSC